MSQLYASQPPRKPGFEEFERTFQLHANNYYGTLTYDEKKAYQRGMIDMMATIKGSGMSTTAPTISSITPSPSSIGLPTPPASLSSSSSAQSSSSLSSLPAFGSQLAAPFGSSAQKALPMTQLPSFNTYKTPLASSSQPLYSKPSFASSKSMPLSSAGKGSQTTTVSSSQPATASRYNAAGAATPAGTTTVQLAFVGMRHRGNHRFQPSDVVSLENEDDNKYDKLAVKVLVLKNKKLHHAAYVTKDDAKVLREKWPSGLYFMGKLQYVTSSYTGDTVHYRISFPPP
ncbi:hypothetical protein BGZ83_004874 [Gryganskiella cystojenkinii]|nr:hypothetical protein BGZ83_004874 [Gryganskiella cystojenkinii]